MNSERASRWIELAVSVGASVLTSAIVVSWTISATLAELRVRVDGNTAADVSLSAELGSIRNNDAVQTATIAKMDAHYEDIVRRLEDLQRKLDKFH
jgi:hypothetical protein